MDDAIGTQETMLVEEIKEITSANRAITVLSDDDYEMAGDLLGELKHKEKLAKEFFGPMVADAHKAHKTVKARENEVIKPLIEAKRLVGAEMGRYRFKKEAEARKEREREQAEARRAAEEREAEAARAAEVLEAEAKLAAAHEADLARKAAALVDKGKLAEAREAEAAREAAEHEAETKLDEALEVLEEAEAVQEEVDNLPVIEEQATPAVEGTSYRTTWKYEIVDPTLIPSEYMTVDEKAIGGVVRSMKEKTSIPGVRVYSTKSIV